MKEKCVKQEWYKQYQVTKPQLVKGFTKKASKGKEAAESSGTGVPTLWGVTNSEESDVGGLSTKVKDLRDY